jgi:hypothetical protein
LRTTARHLVLFYYDEDQISLGSFLTYKILPLENETAEKMNLGMRRRYYLVPLVNGNEIPYTSREVYRKKSIVSPAKV